MPNLSCIPILPMKIKRGLAKLRSSKSASGRQQLLEGQVCVSLLSSSVSIRARCSGSAALSSEAQARPPRWLHGVRRGVALTRGLFGMDVLVDRLHLYEKAH